MVGPDARKFMRLLIMGNNSGLGGAQTAFRKLCEFGCAEGHEVYAIALQSGNFSPPVSATYASITIDAETRSLMGKLRKYVNLTRAAVQAKRFAPDVFVTVGIANSANFIARRLSKNTFSVAQDFIHGRRIDDPLLVATLASFDALAVQSPSMIAALKNQAGKPLTVNWLPCFPEGPVEGLIHSPPPVNSGIKLAYFGRLASNKGLPMLLNAFATAPLDAGTSLDVWGEGGVREELRDLISTHGLQDRVRLMGKYPSGEEGARSMCSYHALILPSTANEGLPLILLEAMAYGIPVVTTDVGAIRDCCEGNDDFLLVKPDLKELTGALAEMANRIRSGYFRPDRLRSWYQTHFSPNVMGLRWRQFLASPSAFFQYEK